MSSEGPSSALSVRRALVFAITNQRGEIDEATVHALVALRTDVDSITVVGGLGSEGVARAEQLADDVCSFGPPGRVSATAAGKRMCWANETSSPGASRLVERCL